MCCSDSVVACVALVILQEVNELNKAIFGLI